MKKYVILVMGQMQGGEEMTVMQGGKLNCLNHIFTRNTFDRLLMGKSDYFYDAVIEKYIGGADDHLSNKDMVEEIYDVLKQSYRNEYFYKNTLLNKLLLHVHSIRTTTALRELSIGKAKADFVLINGKAIVYEIKTELDNFERLRGQIFNYYRAFDHVVVVTSIKNEASIVNYRGLPHTVGIYLLRRNGSFKHVREPEKNNSHIEPHILFTMLRKSEYEEILRKYYGYLPDVGQFNYYRACQELFVQIPLDISYSRVLKQLKKRVSVDEAEFDEVPDELKFLVYFMDFDRKAYLKLFRFLRETYRRE